MLEMSKSKTCPVCGKKNTANNSRREKVIRLRKTGLTWAAIGERLGISPQAAHQIHRRALEVVHGIIQNDGGNAQVCPSNDS
jgi:DNA-binding NarL/FixJ family response regulator